MITAATRLVTLLGHPVSHSLSPRMQNAAFAARALDWVYVACDVDPDALPAAVAGLRALGFAGANVTIPHKGAVAELCDELDDLARASGAVNTLVLRDGGRTAPRPAGRRPRLPPGRAADRARRSGARRRLRDRRRRPRDPRPPGCGRLRALDRRRGARRRDARGRRAYRLTHAPNRRRAPP